MTLEQAVLAHSEAVEAVLRQRELVREVQAQLQFLEDERTRTWVALQDANRAVRRQRTPVDREVLDDINKAYNKAKRG